MLVLSEATVVGYKAFIKISPIALSYFFRVSEKQNNFHVDIFITMLFKIFLTNLISIIVVVLLSCCYLIGWV